MDLISKLERWHKLLSECAGEMSLALARGKGLSRSEAEGWIRSLEIVIDEVRKIVKK